MLGGGILTSCGGDDDDEEISIPTSAKVTKIELSKDSVTELKDATFNAAKFTITPVKSDGTKLESIAGTDSRLSYTLTVPASEEGGEATTTDLVSGTTKLTESGTITVKYNGGEKPTAEITLKVIDAKITGNPVKITSTSETSASLTVQDDNGVSIVSGSTKWVDSTDAAVQSFEGGKSYTLKTTLKLGSEEDAETVEVDVTTLTALWALPHIVNETEKGVGGTVSANTEVAALDASAEEGVSLTFVANGFDKETVWDSIIAQTAQAELNLGALTYRPTGGDPEWAHLYPGLGTGTGTKDDDYIVPKAVWTINVKGEKIEYYKNSELILTFNGKLHQGENEVSAEGYTVAAVVTAFISDAAKNGLKLLGSVKNGASISNLTINKALSADEVKTAHYALMPKVSSLKLESASGEAVVLANASKFTENKDKFKVTATYDDKSSAVLDSSKVTFKIKSSEGNEEYKEVTDSALSGGTYTLKAFYADPANNNTEKESDELTFTVDKAVSSIAINTEKVQKKFYIGEDFTYEGLTATATYDDNSTAEIALASLEISGGDTKATGKKTVTVSYGTASQTYEIEVFRYVAYLAGEGATVTVTEAKVGSTADTAAQFEYTPSAWNAYAEFPKLYLNELTASNVISYTFTETRPGNPAGNWINWAFALRDGKDDTVWYMRADGYTNTMLWGYETSDTTLPTDYSVFVSKTNVLTVTPTVENSIPSFKIVCKVENEEKMKATYAPAKSGQVQLGGEYVKISNVTATLNNNNVTLTAVQTNGNVTNFDQEGGVTQHASCNDLNMREDWTLVYSFKEGEHYNEKTDVWFNWAIQVNAGALWRVERADNFGWGSAPALYTVTYDSNTVTSDTYTNKDVKIKYTNTGATGVLVMETYTVDNSTETLISKRTFTPANWNLH